MEHRKYKNRLHTLLYLDFLDLEDDSVRREYNLKYFMWLMARDFERALFGIDARGVEAVAWDNARNRPIQAIGLSPLETRT